jgi:hypothetical protein
MNGTRADREEADADDGFPADDPKERPPLAVAVAKWAETRGARAYAANVLPAVRQLQAAATMHPRSPRLSR